MVKSEIKSEITRNGWTMTEVVAALNQKHGRNDTVQNLSNKLSKGTLRYSEAMEIAEVIGCRLEWKKVNG
ncbi:DUF6471 domain-containing protein [Paenibacillus camelliae]|uniref:DUF6471 domain-containing protein n=1 Tax=Paenibacillus camelliae TaxID=512410 RepID=UPI002559AD7F|nr:DUF6471 domain-containing protein [Paenibacillus camelliae]